MLSSSPSRVAWIRAGEHRVGVLRAPTFGAVNGTLPERQPLSDGG